MYWVVFQMQNGKCRYLASVDEYGFAVFTENKNEALPFYNFYMAMQYFNLGVGYCVEKVYV